MQPGSLTPFPSSSRFSSLSQGEIELARADAERAWKILDACPDSVLTLHENGRILSLNTAAQKSLGYLPDTPQPRMLSEVLLLPAEGGYSLQSLMGRVWELNARRQDGSQFPCELTVTRPELDQAPVFTAYLRDITDRKKADQALRESELRFRALFEQASVSMQRFSPDGRSVHVNRAYEALFQLTDEQLAAANFNLFEDAQIAAAGLVPLLKRAFAGEAVLAPPTAYCPDKSVAGGRAETRHIRGHFFPIRDSKGEITEIFSIHEDATELILAERALRELNLDLEAKIAERTRALEQEIEERRTTEAALSKSEQRFRAIVETQVELVSRYTPDGVVTYVNPAHERLYGLKPGEYLGKNWIEMIPAKLAETMREKIAALTPAAPVFEVFHPKTISALGRVSHEHWVNRGLFDDNGQLLEVQAVGRDVTEIVQTEQRRKESETKFRRLFEETHAGVVLIDGSTVLEVNPAGLKMFGLSEASQAAGHSLLEFSADRQANGVLSTEAVAQIAELRNQDGSSRFEWICRNSSGAEFPIEAFSSTVEIGGRTLALAILQDISERKRAEQELRNALERERELSQLKSSFISMVSHEYRNPLGIILSSTELMKRYHDRLSEAEKLESLLDIEVATRRMAVMIDNLLLMGKADAGKLVMVPKPVDLLEFCQIVINESLSSNDSQRVIRLEAQGIDSFATADEQLLRIILSNLLTNALKYSPPDRSPSLSVARVGRHAIFKIHDDGIGIPDEDRPALFQAFRRARNVGVVSGTGLGLYIVKHCVDLHAGTIELESMVGKGTTMTLTLPLFPSTTDARSSTNTSSSSSSISKER